MTIVSLSMSHRTPPAEVLERLVVSSAQRAGMLARLCALPSIDEVAVLSTCNRVGECNVSGHRAQVSRDIVHVWAVVRMHGRG
jgi:glutamyl-tRNA reductase